MQSWMQRGFPFEVVSRKLYCCLLKGRANALTYIWKRPKKSKRSSCDTSDKQKACKEW